MFMIMILGAWTVFHVYVLWRVAAVPAIARRVPGKAIAAAGVLLWSGFFLEGVARAAGMDRLSWTVEVIAAHWLGVLFLTFVCLLVADLATGFGYFWPNRAATVRQWALVAGLGLSLVALVQGMRPPVVRSYEVQVPGLARTSDGTVLVVASDFHLGALLGERWLAARIEQINAQKPDLVILAGDIVEGHGIDQEALLPVLRRLSPPLGVWAVNGNHETYGETGAGGRLLEEAGFHVLRDQWAEVRPDLVIAGVDDLTARRRRLGRDAEFVDRALSGRPAGATTVFVSHTPWLAERAASQGVALMVSGHTHGGQIWPFNYVVRLTYPMMAARYDAGGMPVIVSRGAGTWGPRMRLWHPGEIVRITLRAPAAAQAAE